MARMAQEELGNRIDRRAGNALPTTCRQRHGTAAVQSRHRTRLPLRRRSARRSRLAIRLPRTGDRFEPVISLKTAEEQSV